MNGNTSIKQPLEVYSYNNKYLRVGCVSSTVLRAEDTKVSKTVSAAQTELPVNFRLSVYVSRPDLDAILYTERDNSFSKMLIAGCRENAKNSEQ